MPKIVNIIDGKKDCSTCKLNKEVFAFNKSISYKSGLQSVCKDCQREYRLIQENRDKANDRAKKYYLNNKTRVQKYQKEYALDNRSEINFKTNNKYKVDLNYRITKNLRNRIYKVLKGLRKTKSTLLLLGCSLENFKLHLQQTAIDNGYLKFDVNSYDGSQYHIDHIIPCSSFNLIDPVEQEKCFHYSNLSN